ncbi:MAG: TrmH family RNA methyltransferase [Fimbriimonas sp.]|nr:TrmH family RNA methyltransferase [Fimbriimonas sp.]
MKTILSKTGVRKLNREMSESRNSDVQLAFLLQDWEDAYNVGGMFRVADACGAHEMVFSGRTPAPPNPQIGVTSLGHHRRVQWRELGRNEEAAVALKDEGYSLIAVELADGAQHYMEFSYPSRVCLVLGNEGKGVYGT